MLTRHWVKLMSRLKTWNRFRKHYLLQLDLRLTLMKYSSFKLCPFYNFFLMSCMMIYKSYWDSGWTGSRTWRIGGCWVGRAAASASYNCSSSSSACSCLSISNSACWPEKYYWRRWTCNITSWDGNVGRMCVCRKDKDFAIHGDKIVWWNSSRKSTHGKRIVSPCSTEEPVKIDKSFFFFAYLSFFSG